MSEAKQLYDDILCALSPLLPRTVYQDVRRVRTLAWAITGLCLLHSVRLSAWAEVVKPPDPERRAPGPALLGALLHHPAIVPAQWYRPVIQAALSGWPVEQRLFIALDTTALLPFVLIRACLVYRGRAIPLAWRVMRHRSTRGSVLKPTSPCSGPRVCHRASRSGHYSARPFVAFCTSNCLTPCRNERRHFRLRLKGSTLVHLGAQPISAGRRLCPPAGESRFFQQVSILGAAVGPVHLALTRLLDQPDDPWFVVNDEPTDAKTLDEYGLRFEHSRNFP